MNNSTEEVKLWNLLLKRNKILWLDNRREENWLFMIVVETVHEEVETILPFSLHQPRSPNSLVVTLQLHPHLPPQLPALAKVISENRIGVVECDHLTASKLIQHLLNIEFFQLMNMILPLHFLLRLLHIFTLQMLIFNRHWRLPLWLRDSEQLFSEPVRLVWSLHVDLSLEPHLTSCWENTRSSFQQSWSGSCSHQ